MSCSMKVSKVIYRECPFPSPAIAEDNQMFSSCKLRESPMPFSLEAAEVWEAFSDLH